MTAEGGARATIRLVTTPGKSHCIRERGERRRRMVSTQEVCREESKKERTDSSSNMIWFLLAISCKAALASRVPKRSSGGRLRLSSGSMSSKAKKSVSGVWAEAR
jgi:hypothetical protein